MKKGSTTKFRLNPKRPPKTDWFSDLAAGASPARVLSDGLDRADQQANIVLGLLLSPRPDREIPDLVEVRLRPRREGVAAHAAAFALRLFF
jgi:hypothetical protein